MPDGSTKKYHRKPSAQPNVTRNISKYSCTVYELAVLSTAISKSALSRRRPI